MTDLRVHSSIALWIFCLLRRASGMYSLQLWKHNTIFLFRMFVMHILTFSFCSRTVRVQSVQERNEEHRARFIRRFMLKATFSRWALISDECSTHLRKADIFDPAAHLCMAIWSFCPCSWLMHLYSSHRPNARARKPMNQCPPACLIFFCTAAYSANLKKDFLSSLLSQNFNDFCTIRRNSICSSFAATHRAYARAREMLIQYCIALPI